jgi:hypothetical protein
MSHKWSKPLVIVALIILIGGVYLWQTGKPSGAVMMKVIYRGGLCSTGNICESSHRLYENGVFEGHTKLNRTELNKLKATITNTDFLGYGVNPRPNCQSAVDGSDEVLEFPQKYPGQSFTLCLLNIPANDSAVSYINKLIDDHYKAQE